MNWEGVLMNWVLPIGITLIICVILIAVCMESKKRNLKTFFNDWLKTTWYIIILAIVLCFIVLYLLINFN